MALLDPRTRNFDLGFNNEKYREDAISAVRTLMEDFYGESVGSESDHEVETLDDGLTNFANFAASQPKRSDDEDPIMIYLGLSTFEANPFAIIKSKDPFEWWEESKVRLPVLANLARFACMILSHPPTSAFSERIFSYAGVQTGGIRSSLSVRRLNSRELLKFSIHLMSEEDWAEYENECQ